MRISDWSSDVCSSDLNGRGSGEGLSDTPGGWKTGGEGLQGGHLLPDESLDARALSIAGSFVIEIQKATDLAQVECLLEAAARSDERRVGKEGVRTCRSRWWRVNEKKKPKTIKQ